MTFWVLNVLFIDCHECIGIFEKAFSIAIPYVDQLKFHIAW